MGDPYWPWWVVILFFLSGAWSAWVLTVARRPAWVICPACNQWIRHRDAGDFRNHYKECEHL